MLVCLANFKLAALIDYKWDILYIGTILYTVRSRIIGTKGLYFMLKEIGKSYTFLLYSGKIILVTLSIRLFFFKNILYSNSLAPQKICINKIKVKYAIKINMPTYSSKFRTKEAVL